MKHYTDPLQAAFMARDYGVKFTSQMLFQRIRRGEILSVSDGEKYIVAPESEHIFQPQVGDVVTFKTDDGCLCVDAVEQVYFQGDESYPYVGNGDTVIQLCASHPDWIHAADTKIIQRNGKAFFMPEEEQ